MDTIIIGSGGSHETDLSLTCPACHGKGVFHTWDCINGSADPSMRQRVLHDQSLFFYTCPHCQRAIRVEEKCLYIDKKKHFMVWHIPDLKMTVTSGEVEDFLGQPDFSGYDCRVALTWGEWREKIIEMESSFDDRLYELVKYGAYQLLKQEQKEKLPLEMYHLDYADDQYQPDQLALVFMEEDQKGNGYVYPVNTKMLEVTHDVFLPVLQKLSPQAGKGVFERYGYSWAEHFMKYIIEAAKKPGMETYSQLVGFWIRTIGREIFQTELKGQ